MGGFASDTPSVEWAGATDASTAKCGTKGGENRSPPLQRNVSTSHRSFPACPATLEADPVVPFASNAYPVPRSGYRKMRSFCAPDRDQTSAPPCGTQDGTARPRAQD